MLPRTALSGLIALALSGAARAADIAPALKPAPVVLVDLGAVIQASLPQMPEAAGLGLTLDKAHALLARADAADPSALREQARSLAGQELPKATKLLVSINSVLQDIPTERLATMPAETLRGLSGLIFEQFAHRDDFDARGSVDALVELSQARVARIAASGGPVKRFSHKEPAGLVTPALKKVYFAGAPKEARWLSGKDRPALFRHYVEGSSAHNIHRRLIEDGNDLQTSKVPYVKQLFNWFSKKVRIYTDLTGVFLTLPDVSPEAVGVPERAQYLDVRIPEELPLLEIEPGRIYMVPLPARAESLDRRLFLDQLGEGQKPRRPEKLHEDYFRLLDTHGLPGPTLSIPIEIVGAGERPPTPPLTVPPVTRP